MMNPSRLSTTIQHPFAFGFFLAALLLLLNPVQAFSQSKAKQEKASEWITQAEGFVNRGKLGEAINAYTKALELVPDHPLALFNRSVCLLDAGYPDLALEDATKLCEISGAGYKLMANIYIQKKEFNNALKYADLAIKAESEDPNVYYLKATTLKALQRTQDLVDFLRKMEEKFPHLMEPKAMQVDPLQDLGKHDEALAIINKVLETSMKAKYYLVRYQAYLRIGKYEEALADINRAIAKEPESAYLYTYKSTVLKNLKRFDEAIENLNALVKQDPGNPGFLAERAQGLAEMLRFEDALNDIRKAIEMEPENPVFELIKGMIYYQMGEFAIADSITTHAARNEKNLADRSMIKHNLVLIKTRGGWLSEALPLATEVIESSTGSAYTYNNRAHIYLMMGKLDEAEADINKSMELNPSNGWVYRNRGVLKLKRGDADGALKDFETALEKDGPFELVAYYTGLAWLAKNEKEKACEQFRTSAERSEPEGKAALQKHCN